MFHDFQISTPCGSFTFGTGLIDNLAGMLDPTQLIQGLQTTATNLIGAAISQLPMVSLCYAAPTMCDIVKYLQELVNEILQFKGLSCQQAEQLFDGNWRQAEWRENLAVRVAAAACGLDVGSSGDGMSGRFGRGGLSTIRRAWTLRPAAVTVILNSSRIR